MKQSQVVSVVDVTRSLGRRLKYPGTRCRLSCLGHTPTVIALRSCSARHAPRFCLLASDSVRLSQVSDDVASGGVALWPTESGVVDTGFGAGSPCFPCGRSRCGLWLPPVLDVSHRDSCAEAVCPGAAAPGSMGSLGGGRLRHHGAGATDWPGGSPTLVLIASRAKSSRRSACSRCSGRPAARAVPVSMANTSGGAMSGRTTPACRSTETASSISSWLFRTDRRRRRSWRAGRRPCRAWRWRSRGTAPSRPAAPAAAASRAVVRGRRHPADSYPHH